MRNLCGPDNAWTQSSTRPQPRGLSPASPPTRDSSLALVSDTVADKHAGVRQRGVALRTRTIAARPHTRSCDAPATRSVSARPLVRSRLVHRLGRAIRSADGREYQRGRDSARERDGPGRWRRFGGHVDDRRGDTGPATAAGQALKGLEFPQEEGSKDECGAYTTVGPCKPVSRVLGLTDLFPIVVTLAEHQGRDLSDPRRRDCDAGRPSRRGQDRFRRQPARWCVPTLPQ